MSAQISMFDKSIQITELDKQGSFVKYYPNFLNNKDANNLLDSLLNEIQWDDNTKVVYGKLTKFNRMSSFYSRSGIKYNFSSRSFSGHRFTDKMKEIMSNVEQSHGYDFNCILFNLYNNGNDSISWHADNEKELGSAPVVGTLSLGQKRPFLLRNNDNHKIKHEFELGGGSLMIMDGNTQKYWEHSVPKRAKLKNKRLSITFRKIIV